MNKMIKKVAAIALSAVMIGGCFAGCSAGAKDDGKAENKDTYKVGILQLVQHEALDKATDGFKDKLTELMKEAGKTVEFDYQNASGDSAACPTIANQFVSNKVDLIMANATASLQASATATAASKIPVVGTSITDFGVALDIEMGSTDATGINVTGSNDLAPLDKQAEQITTLFPKAKKIGCLYCSAEPNSKFQVEGIKEALTAKNIDCEFYSFTDTNDIQAVAKEAASKSDVIYIPTDNTAASNGAVISAACKEAKTPIIAGEDGIFKKTEAVATLSISFYEIGQKAGEMAFDILVNGKDPSTMNIWQTSNVKAYYNDDMAKMYNVTIPDGYEVLKAE